MSNEENGTTEEAWDTDPMWDEGDNRAQAAVMVAVGEAQEGIKVRKNKSSIVLKQHKVYKLVGEAQSDGFAVRSFVFDENSRNWVRQEAYDNSVGLEEWLKTEMAARSEAGPIKADGDVWSTQVDSDEASVEGNVVKLPVRATEIVADGGVEYDEEKNMAAVTSTYDSQRLRLFHVKYDAYPNMHIVMDKEADRYAFYDNGHLRKQPKKEPQPITQQLIDTMKSFM